MIEINYNPDVLSCIANLSNDEVFTSPTLVNKMLDILPTDLWKNKNAKFLDPVSKTGVFLREITKRLINGLENEIPDLQERINHILKNQVFGIAITELTFMLSKRSLYCSKDANSDYSICTTFSDSSGNIYYKNITHTWELAKCVYCGANREVYDRPIGLETYAYNFIHLRDPKEIFNMKFDVIIGNPPYQLSDGGAQASAIPLYHKFVQQAKKLQPRYLSMIIPSRWFTGGKGLDEFRDEMLRDKSLRVIHDFLDASECFPGVDIKGGVCFFLWDRDHKGKCKVVTHKDGKVVSTAERDLLEKGLETFIRYNEAIGILSKVQRFHEASFNHIISARKPFGLATDFRNFESRSFPNSVKIYANQKSGFINRIEILKNQSWIDLHKILVPYAIGSGDSHTDILKPIYAEPGSCCTETYLVFGPFKSKLEADNCISYINTKFFHFLLTLIKNTQHATSKAYQLVPLQDFSVEWSDEKLFTKYGINNDEADFIIKMVSPLEK